MTECYLITSYNVTQVIIDFGLNERILQAYRFILENDHKQIDTICKDKRAWRLTSMVTFVRIL